MLEQINSLKELQFLAYLTALLLGIQLSIYFFYQYKKIGSGALQLNRILLSFGSFLLFAILGAFILTINRFFITESRPTEFLNKISYTLILLSTISFLLFIQKPSFDDLVNLTVGKVLMVLGLIPIIMVWIFPSTSQAFRLSITFTLLSAITIIGLQIKLVKIAVGEIKTRFILIFFGDLICLFALFLASEIPMQLAADYIDEEIVYIKDIIFFIGVGGLVFGFLLIMMAAYKFPPFYEFEWKDNLIKLLIINNLNNNCLYMADLITAEDKDVLNKDKREESREKLFSGGIMGIDGIISSVTQTQEEKLNKIKQGDSIILLKHGSEFPIPLTYALVVKKELNSIDYFLDNIKIQFESFYKDILSDYKTNKIKNEEQLFSSFDVLLKNLMI